MRTQRRYTVVRGNKQAEVIGKKIVWISILGSGPSRYLDTKQLRTIQSKLEEGTYEVGRHDLVSRPGPRGFFG